MRAAIFPYPKIGFSAASNNAPFHNSNLIVVDDRGAHDFFVLTMALSLVSIISFSLSLLFAASVVCSMDLLTARLTFFDGLLILLITYYYLMSYSIIRYS